MKCVAIKSGKYVSESKMCRRDISRGHGVQALSVYESYEQASAADRRDADDILSAEEISRRGHS